MPKKRAHELKTNRKTMNEEKRRKRKTNKQRKIILTIIDLLIVVVVVVVVVLSVVPIVLKLRTYSLVSGNSDTFLCEAGGYPIPNVTWIGPNGKDLGNGSGKALLPVRNMSRAIVGIYTCIANNTVGSNEKNTSVTLIGEYFLWAQRLFLFLLACSCK